MSIKVIVNQKNENSVNVYTTSSWPPNLYEFLPSAEHKKKLFWRMGVIGYVGPYRLP